MLPVDESGCLSCAKVYIVLVFSGTSNPRERTGFGQKAQP